MDTLSEYFQVLFTEDKTIASIDYISPSKRPDENVKIELDEWNEFLKKNDVKHGFQLQAIKSLRESISEVSFPLVIAKGQPAVHGRDGEIEYINGFDPNIKRNEKWNFREMMKTPFVKKGEKIAEIKEPESGTDGIDVTGKKIKAFQGKPVKISAGKNVLYQENNLSFFAAVDGQISVSRHKINIHPIYEVKENLSKKNGNLDYSGTIIIHGDVPAGYTIHAGGDVIIFGLVEAASITAEGSIYISEGITGQDKASLKAGENIGAGYINQATITCGRDLYAEKSIVHSNCTVSGHLYSQQGSIIGGITTCNKIIEVREAGTKFNTKTEIHFNTYTIDSNRKNKLMKQKQQLEIILDKLRELGEKLKETKNSNVNVQISLLRQRNTYTKTKQQLEEINEELQKLDSPFGGAEEPKLLVHDFIYQDVSIAFGKYKRVMNSDHRFVQVRLKENEITLSDLSE